MNKRLLVAMLVLWMATCVYSVRAEQPQAWKIVMAGSPSTLQAFRMNTATGQTWQKDISGWKLMAEPAAPFAGDLGSYECSMYAANSGVWALRWNRNTGDTWILRDNGWNKTQFDTPPAAGSTPGAWQIAGDNTEKDLVAILLNSVTGQSWQLSSGNWAIVADSILPPAGTVGTYTCHVQDAPNGWWALRTNLKTGQSWRLASTTWLAIPFDMPPSADSTAQGVWNAAMSGSGGTMGAVVFNAATGQTWQWADTFKLIADPAPLPPANAPLYDVGIYDGPDVVLGVRWNIQTGQSWQMQNNAWQEMQSSQLPVGNANSLLPVGNANALLPVGNANSLLPVGGGSAAPSSWKILIAAPNKFSEAMLLNTASGQSWKKSQAQWLPLADNSSPPVASPGDYQASIRNLGDNWTGIRWNVKTGQSWLIAADTWTEMRFDQPASPGSDPAGAWRVTQVGNSIDAEAILLNTSSGQAWRRAAGNWISIADAARLAPAAAGTYQCSAFEEAAGWAAVRWNATTGESWLLGPSAWQAMPAEQPPAPTGLLPPQTNK